MQEQMQSEFDVCECTGDLVQQSEDLLLTICNLREAVQSASFGGFDCDPESSNLAMCDFVAALSVIDGCLTEMRVAMGYLAETMRSNSKPKKEIRVDVSRFDGKPYSA